MFENDFNPVDIDILDEDNCLYILDKHKHCIILFNIKTKEIVIRGGFNHLRRRGYLSYPFSLTVDQQNKEIYVADEFNRISVFDQNLDFISCYEYKPLTIKSIHYSSYYNKLIISDSSDNLTLLSKEALETYLI